MNGPSSKAIRGSARAVVDGHALGLIGGNQAIRFAPWQRETKFVFTNYGVSLGLQAADAWPERVARLKGFFENWLGDEYDREAITWGMACTSHLPAAFLSAVGERPEH